MFKLNNEYVIVVKMWYSKFINEGLLKNGNQNVGKAHLFIHKYFIVLLCVRPMCWGVRTEYKQDPVSLLQELNSDNSPTYRVEVVSSRTILRNNRCVQSCISGEPGNQRKYCLKADLKVIGRNLGEGGEEEDSG